MSTPIRKSEKPSYQDSPDIESQYQDSEVSFRQKKKCGSTIFNVRNVSIFLIFMILLNALVLFKAEDFRELCNSTLANNTSATLVVLNEVLSSSSAQHMDDSFIEEPLTTDYVDDADF